MRPETSRFGSVDFDQFLPAETPLNNGDEFVIRQGGGDNVIATLADIVAAAAVSFPLEAPSGAANDNPYTFADSGGLTGWFSPGLDQMGLAAEGIEVMRLVNPAGDRQAIVSPTGPKNSPSVPVLAFGDGDTGLYESVDDVLNVSIAGTAEFVYSVGSLAAINAAGPAVLNEAASAINPTFVPNKANPDTGIGSQAAGAVSLIGTGTEGLRITSAGAKSVNGTAAAPAYSFINATNSGFFVVPATPYVALSLGGSEMWRFHPTSIQNITNPGPIIIALTPSTSVPTLAPNKTDIDTGTGWAGSGQLSLIGDGVEQFRAGGSGGKRQALFFAGASAAQPGLAVLGDDNTGLVSLSADNLSMSCGGIVALRAEDPADLAATETSLWLYDLDGGVLKQVTVGANDSGGAGTKLLRVAN